MDADSDWEKPHNNRESEDGRIKSQTQERQGLAAFTRSWEEARKDLLSILEGRNPY